MAKKNSWLNLFKRLFTSEAKPEKKEKRRKWIFGRLKIKRLASITAPSEQREKTVGEAEEEQSKRALTVAIASAAAAEAAVAAAQAAAEVVRLTGISLSTHQSEIKTEENSATKTDADAPRLNHYFEDQIQEFAVTKIQTAFRGYLARKALRALKGIVKLQAIIRGQTVRRQARTTLKCLQSIVNIQSQACASRIHTEGAWHSDESRNLPTLRDKIIKVDTNSQRRWDRSTLTKEEADAIILSKREAVMKRERIKEYSYNHRKSAESEQNKGNGRWKYWLEQWVDTQLTKSKEMEDLDLSSDRKLKEELGGKQLRLRSFPREYHIEELGSPLVVPRRSSHHRKQCSLGDDNSFSTSPVVPTYMAATESAKAKSRSFSSPKLRPASFDTQSESYSPYKNKLCLITSTASEAPSSGRINRPSAYQQRSPGLRGLQGPIKSNRMLKDLSINSECSLPNWNRESAFR